jgi:hypothetical protein
MTVPVPKEVTATEVTATEVLRPTTPNPIAVAQMPTVPPPVGALAPSSKRARPKGRLLVGVVTVVAVGAIAFLGLALLNTRGDLDSARARIAQLDVVPPTSAPAAAGGAFEPVVPALDDEVTALQTQLNQITAALTKATEDLDAAREGRAADASAAASAAAVAAADAAAVAQQLAQLQALFPLTSAAVAAADPTGAYAVSLTPQQCTLTDCAPLATMTLSFTDAATVAGDRANGAVTATAGTSVVTGSLDPTLAPLCATVAAPTTYQLSVAVSAVQAVGGVLMAQQLDGTYTETIASGDCAGQLRSYTIQLVRQ